MLRMAWSEPDPRARWPLVSLLVLWIPPVAAFHAVCFALDGILFPGLWRTEIRSPVFVLGHARSGTTLLHRLLSRDSGRFSSFLYYEMFFPSILEKRTIRALARLDRRFLGGALARRVRAWEDRRYALVRKVHEMGLTQPEEDDTVLYGSCASGFWISRVPYAEAVDFYHVDELPPRRRRRLMAFYRDCVRRQLYLNGDDKIHLSKNPVFAGRVEALIETFPDARFVVPVRNPHETIPSLLALLRGGWRRLPFDPERTRRSLQLMAEQSFHTYRHPAEVLARHPGTRHATVDYRDLVADPAATVEQVYRELELPMTPEYRETLLAEGKRSRQHTSGHRYSLEKFGLEADAIRTRLADLFERYGWDAGAGA